MLEYAFFLNPQIQSRHGLPAAAVVHTNGNQYAAIVFARRPPPSELIYRVQTSTNLSHWLNGSYWADHDQIPANEWTTATTDGTNTLVRLNAPLPAAWQTFLRVQVEKPE